MTRIDVWPRVSTRGRLEPAEGEWLHTNGAGGYAMSTLALMHTRRFHGLLVAALEPPSSRYVIVSHAETSIRVGSRLYQLATHQFPDVAPTPGYRLLREFAQDPLPRWTYRLGKSDLERRLCMVRGQSTTVLSYTWRGKLPAKMTLRPLLPMRPIHELRSEHGGLLQRVVLRRNEVRVQPVRTLPQVIFGHRATFVGSPDWWRRFEYAEDMNRHVHYQEDLWTPGVFEWDLLPNEPVYLTMSVGAAPERSPGDLMAEAVEFLLEQDPGTHHSMPARMLSVAAEQFRAVACERPSTIAGYPWLGVHSRDTLISLPGLYLAPGKIDDAVRVLRTTMGRRRDGFLLSGQSEADPGTESISVDSSLWLFEAARQLREHRPADDPFIRDELFPALCSIFERIVGGDGEPCWLTPEGLLVARSTEGPQTWMDSRLEGAVVTPRYGIAVEVQALWNRALMTLSELASALGERELPLKCETLATHHGGAFARYFWNAAERYPYDCLSEASPTEGDPTIRPNALLALDVAPHLFEPSQAEAIVYRVRDRLLTPAGVRTLDPDDPHYIGYYEGTMGARRAAYHQGVAWTYLLGAYSRAVMRIWPDDFDLQVELRDLVVSALRNTKVVGQVGQVASGDRPHHPGGCPAQAWSVSELLRTLMVELRL